MSSFAALLSKYKSTTDTPDEVSAVAQISQQPKALPFIAQIPQIRNQWESAHLTDIPLSSTNALVIMMIIIDDLPLEPVWRLWLDSQRENVQVLIHAKYPERVRSEWVKCRLSSFHLKPTWGSIELTDVMCRLLREALLKFESASKFMFASETCLPVRTLDECLRCIHAEPHTSWLNYSYTPSNGYAKQGQFDVLKKKLPADCVAKADQWVLLSRIHAQGILSLDQQLGLPLLSQFEGVKASDEMFFPCALSILGDIAVDAPAPPTASTSGDDLATATTGDRKKRTRGSSSVCRRQLTYCDWSERGKSPRTFETLTATDVQMARMQGCFFLRKIKLPPPCTSSENEDCDAFMNNVIKGREQREAFTRHWAALILLPPGEIVGESSDLSFKIKELTVQSLPLPSESGGGNQIKRIKR